ncbi:MAG TPA: VOC family protein, partial [Candidatus Binatia bacterium]|nr:VOC family protein [Candidatus Binatia bacterium]
QIGGMMNSTNFPRPMWLYYFGTANIDDAAKRVTANGGAILHGPVEVPGGGFIVQARDPQGAMFALVGRRG